MSHPVLGARLPNRRSAVQSRGSTGDVVVSTHRLVKQFGPVTALADSAWTSGAVKCTRCSARTAAGRARLPSRSLRPVD